METIKQYLYHEKQIQDHQNRIKSYHNKHIFKSQIFELKSLIRQSKIELNNLEQDVRLDQTKADFIRINLIQTIKNVLEDIRKIKQMGGFPPLQGRYYKPACMFWDILYSLQQIIVNEGYYGASQSNLKKSDIAWDSKGLENILDNATILLSLTKFNNLKESIDFFTELAQKFIIEHKRIVGKYYDPFGQLIQY